MVSWAQSRGRARKKRSAFVVLVEQEGGQNVSGLGEVAKWERMEMEMEQHVLDEKRFWTKVLEKTEKESEDEEEYLEFRVRSTGYADLIISLR